MFLNYQKALDAVEISKEDQMKVFSMLSALLWLGNIKFSVIDGENHVEVISNEGKFLLYLLFVPWLLVFEVLAKLHADLISCNT